MSSFLVDWNIEWSDIVVRAVVLGTKDSGLSTNNEELTLFVILEYKIFYQH